MAKTQKAPATQESWNNETPLASVTMQIVRCVSGELGLNWANNDSGHTIGFILPYGAQAWAESLVAAQKRELTIRRVRTSVRAAPKQRKAKVTT